MLFYSRAMRALAHPLLLLVCAALATGCFEEERPTPGGWTPVETQGEAVDFVEPTGPCTPGAAASCKIYLTTHGDVEHCIIGEKQCNDVGEWGECGEPTDTSAPVDGEVSGDDPEAEGQGGGVPV